MIEVRSKKTENYLVKLPKSLDITQILCYLTECSIEFETDALGCLDFVQCPNFQDKVD